MGAVGGGDGWGGWDVEGGVPEENNWIRMKCMNSFDKTSLFLAFQGKYVQYLQYRLIYMYNYKTKLRHTISSRIKQQEWKFWQTLQLINKVSRQKKSSSILQGSQRRYILSDGGFWWRMFCWTGWHFACMFTQWNWLLAFAICSLYIIFTAKNTSGRALTSFQIPTKMHQNQSLW